MALILIVDDSPTEVFVMQKALEKHGFKTSYKEIPGSHYWFLWRDFLGDFGSILFR